MKYLDRLLERLLSCKLAVLLPKVPGVFIGARRGTQTCDIGHGINLLMEKGLDCQSKSAVCQADIKRYYDSLPLLKIARWLLSKGVDRSLLAAALRHQFLSKLVVQRGQCVEAVVNRCMGGLTGSNVALAMARIPVEATFLKVFDGSRGAASSAESASNWYVRHGLTISTQHPRTRRLRARCSTQFSIY